MLDHPHHFRETSYSLPATGQATTSYVDFNFNFLPVFDPYSPPVNPNVRANPSVARKAALFDWWERLFDYTTLKCRVRETSCRQVWLLFEKTVQQAHLNQPSNQGQRTEPLFRHLSAHLHDSSLLTYYAPTMKTAWTSNLLDERWPICVWHADQYVRALQKVFLTQHLTKAAPSLWASDNPNAVIGGDSGNANLVIFVSQSLLESHDIRETLGKQKTSAIA
jgi:hypothetical protein